MDLSDVEAMEVEKKLFMTEDKLRSYGEKYKQDVIDLIHFELMKNTRDIFTLVELRYYTSKLKYFSTLCLYDKLGKFISFFEKQKKLKEKVNGKTDVESEGEYGGVYD
jgi:hypothetical protein